MMMGFTTKRNWFQFCFIIPKIHGHITLSFVINHNTFHIVTSFDIIISQGSVAKG